MIANPVHNSFGTITYLETNINDDSSKHLPPYLASQCLPELYQNHNNYNYQQGSSIAIKQHPQKYNQSPVGNNRIILNLTEDVRYKPVSDPTSFGAFLFFLVGINLIKE